MQTTVAIVGGGLAGLYAARRLSAAGIDYQLFEARERLGGRVLSADHAGLPSTDGLDLGPSWFWPGIQPQLLSLTRELGLASFVQHSAGDALFERTSREPAQRVRTMRQEPESMRLAGGTGALITALEAALRPEQLHCQHRLTDLTLRPDGVDLTFVDAQGGSLSVRASQVLIALPPRLAAAVSFTPALDPAIVARWESTPTWMAAHAKLVALYDKPFWREIGLSGTAQSVVGPLAEIHDATTHAGSAALFGFLGVSAAQRAALGEQALSRACVAQLVRLFGEQAAQPRHVLFKDWTADALTATKADHEPSGHPMPTRGPWVSEAWKTRLSLGGSETSMREPGYLAGAVDAAERAVAEIIARIDLSTTM